MKARAKYTLTKTHQKALGMHAIQNTNVDHHFTYSNNV